MPRKFMNKRKDNVRERKRVDPVIDTGKKKVAALVLPPALAAFAGLGSKPANSAEWPNNLRVDIPFELGVAYSNMTRMGSNLEMVDTGFRVRLGEQREIFNVFLLGEYSYTDAFIDFIHKDTEYRTFLEGHQGAMGLELLLRFSDGVALNLLASGFGGTTEDGFRKLSTGAESSVTNPLGGFSASASLGVRGWVLLEGGYSSDTRNEAFARMLFSAIPSWMSGETIDLELDYRRMNFLNIDSLVNKRVDNIVGSVRIPVYTQAEFGLSLIGFTEWELGNDERSRHGGGVELDAGPVGIVAGADHHGRMRFAFELYPSVYRAIEGEGMMRDVEGSRDYMLDVRGGYAEGEVEDWPAGPWMEPIEKEERREAPVESPVGEIIEETEPAEEPAPVEEPAPADEAVVLEPDESDVVIEGTETAAVDADEEPAEGEAGDLIPLEPVEGETGVEAGDAVLTEEPIGEVDIESTWRGPERKLQEGKNVKNFHVFVDGEHRIVPINMFYVGNGKMGLEGYMYSEGWMRRNDVKEMDGFLSGVELKRAGRRDGIKAARKRAKKLLKESPEGVQAALPLNEAMKRLLQEGKLDDKNGDTIVAGDVSDFELIGEEGALERVDKWSEETKGRPPILHANKVFIRPVVNMENGEPKQDAEELKIPVSAFAGSTGWYEKEKGREKVRESLGNFFVGLGMARGPALDRAVDAVIRVEEAKDGNIFFQGRDGVQLKKKRELGDASEEAMGITTTRESECPYVAVNDVVNNALIKVLLPMSDEEEKELKSPELLDKRKNELIKTVLRRAKGYLWGRMAEDKDLGMIRRNERLIDDKGREAIESIRKMALEDKRRKI